MMESNPRDEFLRVATWHGTLERAEAIIGAHPELRQGDIHVAAVLGDDAEVRRLIAAKRENTTAKSGPYQIDPIVYLCLSKYLRLDPSRSEGFLAAAIALLDAGADPDSGFWNNGEFETALYGAAGVAHHEAMTRLLVE